MKYKHEFNWALKLTAVSALWLALQYFTGLHSTHIHLHPLLGMLWYIFALIVIFLSIKNLRDQSLEGELYFWSGVQSGTMVAVISLPMHLVLYLLYYSTVGSIFFESAISYSLELGIDREEVEAFFNLPVLLIRETMGIIASGFIISLLSSVFLKTDH